jgi:cobalt-zinc-cadmium efflux system membrane fusion protein
MSKSANRNIIRVILRARRVAEKFKPRARHILPAGAVLAAAALSFLASESRSSAVAIPPASGALSSLPKNPAILSLSPGAMRNANLHFSVAALQPVVRRIEAPATVTVSKMHMAAVSAPVRARVEAIDVAPGQHVVPGQRLAILDYVELSAVHSRVQGAAAAVAQAKAAAAAADANYARGKAEFEIGVIAKTELERRRAEAARMAADLVMKQASLNAEQEAEAQLRPLQGGSGAVASVAPGPKDWRGAIVSPIEGDVDTVDASPGELVDAGHSVVSVADLSVVTIRGDLPASELPNVKVGQSVSVKIAAYPGRSYTGTLVHIPDAVDPQTGTDPILCAVSNPDGALRANMFGTVTINAPVGRAGVVAPDSALQIVDGRQVIFVPAGKGHFVQRVVKTGVSNDGLTEIQQGLAPGTPIVTDGSYWLKASLLRSTIPDEG